MKLLLEMMLLLESGTVNIANGGNSTITIEDAEGNEIDTINSFNKIMTRFLEREVFAKNARLTEEVKAWYSRNFWNWLKRGGSGIVDENDLALGSLYYEPVSEYIDHLVGHLGDAISRENIIKQFPEYIQKDIDNSVVFSGGRLFRLNKLIPTINHLSDYLLANQAAAANPAMARDFVPPELFIGSKFVGVQPPDALSNSRLWHEWVQANNEKVTRAQLLSAIESLKADVDIKVDRKFNNGCVVVQLLTAHSCDVEGQAMHHCAKTYSQSVEKGIVTLFSVRNAEGLPRCTIEWNDKTKDARQVKGPHDSHVPASVLIATKAWLVERGMKTCGDLHLLRVNSVKEVYGDVQEAIKQGGQI